MELDYRIIGSRIQARRKQKKITQEKMAEALNLSVGFISQIERGVTKLSLDSMAAIAQYLDCSISSIVDDTNQKEINYFQTDFNALYESLDYDDQRLFYYMLEIYVKNKGKKEF